MKRKFSFNKAPVKAAPKDETKAMPDPAPSHSQSQPHSQPPSQSPSHGRHSSKDSISDYSPYINRRVLDSHTERELRLACRSILENFKPSDYGMENVDPKLDFGAMNRPHEGRTKNLNAEPRVRLPTGAPVDLKTALQARGLQQTELTLRAPGDPLPVRANSSRKRADFAWLDERGDKRDDKLRKSSSTRRKSRTIDPAAAADAQAAEWMRQEREKQESQDSAHPPARPSTAVRSLNRSRSIRDNIRDYVFPSASSRSLSRAPSHGSLRTTNTNVSQDSSAVDPPHSAGWRGWTLARKSLSRSNSRPGTSKGQSEEADQAKKPTGINLNRELPPLPSLDSWKDAVKAQPEKDKAKSPQSATHIASLMRPQDQVTPERVSAQNKAHRRSGSDTLAMQFSASMAARSPSHPKHAPQSASRSKTLTPDSLAMTGQTLVGSVSTSQLGHVRQASSDGVASPKKSLNFSRKMSVDTPTRSTFSNEVKIARKEEQRWRLKKVFSGWMTKKDKKDDWMHRLEKEGVKEGVMVQDGGAADAPIVRY